MYVVNNFNCRGFGPLLEDKLCLIFKLAPSVCRMTFPILASLLVRLVVLLPFQLLRLSLATPSRWTPLALSVFLHCVVALLLTLLRSEERFSRNAETDLVCRLLLEKKIGVIILLANIFKRSFSSQLAAKLRNRLLVL